MLLLHREKHVKAYDRVGVFTSIIPIPHVTSWQHNSTSLLQEGIKIKYFIYVYAYYGPRIGKQTMQSHSARTLLLLETVQDFLIKLGIKPLMHLFH